MLTEFRVDNYKSLINVQFRPADQNLLMGVNNAGKTNLCQAIDFLKTSVHVSVSDAANVVAGGLFGVTNRYFDKDTLEFEVRADVPFEDARLSFRYELSLFSQRTAEFSPQMEVEAERLYVTGRDMENVLLIDNTRERVRLLHEADYVKGQPKYAETSAPRDSTMLQRLYDLKSNPRANRFKRYLASWQYYSLSAEAMRSSVHQANNFVLNPDGSNLASVVYQLKTMDERRYRKLVEKTQIVDPRIEVINFFTSPKDQVFMVFEDQQGNGFSSANASGGTLRYLALLYVLFAQPFLDHQPLIVIEEPENGIYVGFLKSLLDLVDAAQTRPQIVFTSHSPYFIDLFDDRLDGVFVIVPGERHSVLKQPDGEMVRSRLEHYPLGEQHFREMLQ